MAVPPPEPEAFAALICDWCLEVKPGQQVLVTSTTLAAEAVRALHRELLIRGAWPLLRMAPPGLARDFFRHAHDHHLDGYAPLELTEAQGVDASVNIGAPADTAELVDVEPELLARRARAGTPVREARLSRRWCGTIWPTPALAEDAGMSLEDYVSFLERALFLDTPAPVAAWRQLSEVTGAPLPPLDGSIRALSRKNPSSDGAAEVPA